MKCKDANLINGEFVYQIQIQNGHASYSPFPDRVFDTRWLATRELGSVGDRKYPSGQVVRVLYDPARHGEAEFVQQSFEIASNIRAALATK